MRRATSTFLSLTLIAVLSLAAAHATATGRCWFDYIDAQLKCEDSGSGGGSNETTPAPDPRVGKRYVHLTTRPGVGECYYWSNTAGGIDAWNVANDAAIINIVTRTPECPVNRAPVVDVVATAWVIFRSWPLDAPLVSLQPAGTGITGLPTYLATPTPESISHEELLPDGRTLSVRAHIEYLDVRWGDSFVVRYQPSGAIPYPDGAVTHTYRYKTCTDEYRTSHPSGGLCHPTLDRYRVTTTFSWFAEYATNGRWIELGSLNRTAETNYFVDEARGISIP